MAVPRWIIPTVLLCLVGLFKEMRPSEPYLTPFLVGPHKNLSEEDVDSKVYPVWTYSYLAALFPVFLLTDLLRYKPVILFEGLAYVGTWVMIIWAQGVQMMQLMQFVYGIATATEIGYYAYIYSAVSSDHYQRVTSYTRSSVLTGRFVAAVLGQLVVSLKVASYLALNYISLCSVGVALVITIFLPSVRKTIYFHQKEETELSDRSETSTDEHIVGGAVRNYNSPACSAVHVDDAAQDTKAAETGGDQEADGLDAPTKHVSLTEHKEHATDFQSNAEDGESEERGQDKTDDLKQPPNSLPSNIPICDTAPADTRNTDGSTEASETVNYCPTNVPREQNNGLDHRTKEMQGRNVCVRTFLPLWRDFKTSYGNMFLLQWSVWWAIATCGNFQVGNYIQVLWEHIYPSTKHPDSEVYNGAVEAAATLAGAAIVFVMQFIRVDWKAVGEIFMGLVSLGDGVLLVFMAKTRQIWVAYIFYVVFRASYQMVITIASFQIASQLQVERYGLVFGCNMFIALALQSIFTALFVDAQGLFRVSVTTQFILNGGYFLFMGAAFFIKGVHTVYKMGLCRRCCRGTGNYEHV